MSRPPQIGSTDYWPTRSQLKLIMKIGPLPDTLPHACRTHWIRGFMAFQLVRHARSVMLMMLA